MRQAGRESSASAVDGMDVQPSSGDGSRRLEGAIAWLVRRRDTRRRVDAAAVLDAMSAPAFRAVVAQRLRALERDLAEVRARINGLLFVVAGAVITQVVLRLFGS
ncbi:MAG: hypothetical protein KGK07_06725 [Chloroflexota bacterium]|nr:hypothetical protein [Chloroflexota bacterium]